MHWGNIKLSPHRSYPNSLVSLLALHRASPSLPCSQGLELNHISSDSYPIPHFRTILLLPPQPKTPSPACQYMCCAARNGCIFLYAFSALPSLYSVMASKLSLGGGLVLGTYTHPRLVSWPIRLGGSSVSCWCSLSASSLRPSPYPTYITPNFEIPTTISQS